VTVAAIILAALCWMSATDRMAKSTYFGGSAAARQAFEALSENDPKTALAQARHAVRTAPIDPASTSALGSSLLVLGRSEQAYAAFVVAGELGWREIPTQLYWLAQATTGGDVDVFAQRLDALLRLNIDNETVNNSLHLMEQTPTGQAALAALLSTSPPWERTFLIATGGLEGNNLDGQIAAIGLAAENGAQLDCDAVGVAVAQLISDGRLLEAKHLWQRACDQAGNADVTDGFFEADDTKRSANPLDWKLLAQAGLDVDVMPAPRPLHGNALRIQSSLTVHATAAKQLLALPPGRYRLSWVTARADGKPDDTIIVALRCNGRESIETSDRGSRQGQGALKTFSVPSQGCPFQTIEIQKAASDSGRQQTGWIDDVQIMPLDTGSTGGDGAG